MGEANLQIMTTETIRQIHSVFETETPSEINQTALMLETLRMYNHPLYATANTVEHQEGKEKAKCKRLFPDNIYVPARVVNDICARYEFVKRDLDMFIGELPEKNLKEIYDFDNKYKQKDWALKILAPESQFIELPPNEDPIVIYEYQYGDNPPCVVVSKWGIGSDDQAIVNPLSN